METIKINYGYKRIWHKPWKKLIKTDEVVIYNNDDELPIENFIQLQKNYLIAAAVGVTINDFDVRLKTLNEHVSGGNKKKAKNEINNLRNLFYNVMYLENPTLDALSCIVHSINGKKMECTESGIARTSEMLSLMEIPMGEVKKVFEVKKKIEEQIKVMHPENTDKINTEWFGAKKRLAMNKLKNIIERNQHIESVEKEERNLSDTMNSFMFGDNEGDDVLILRNFEKQCALLQSVTNKDVKTMNVREFYIAIRTKYAA